MTSQQTLKKKKFRLSLTTKKALSGWIFVLPFVIGILVFYAPILLQSLQFTFCDVQVGDGEFELKWNNFENYKYVYNPPDNLISMNKIFSVTLLDGIKDLILQIPAIVIFALFMAIILNQKMAGRTVFRAIFFLPVILSTGIIDTIDTGSKMLESLANASGGIDTGAGEQEGIMSAMDLQNMLGNIKVGTSLVEYVVKLVNDIFDIVSRSGVQMLIFLSGLQSISPAIYESCQMEGASAWETFWKITLPMISPMILVNAIYTIIDTLTSADNRVMNFIIGNSNSPKLFTRGHLAVMYWSYIMVVLALIIVVALLMKAFVYYQRRD